MTDKKALIQAVKDYALEHYEHGGWDYVVECWGDEDIAEAIGRATTPQGAIRKVAEWAGLLDDRRSDIQGLIF